MKINKDKVIVLPKEFYKNELEFVCPCPVCAEKEHLNRARYLNLQEVKNTIEDILDSTNLRTKEFHINISYTGSEHDAKLESNSTTSNLHELVKIFALVKVLIKFCSQFESKYRHPLMCELREELRGLAINVGLYSSNYSDQKITKNRLWDLQLLISNIDTLFEIVSEIKKEKIFDKKLIDALEQRIKNIRLTLGRQLRALFLEGIESQESVTSNVLSDYSPRVDSKYEI